jgi:hypothetical protein
VGKIDETRMTDPQPPHDYQKWLYEQNRINAERAHDKIDEFFHKNNDAAISTANVALRTALLINGGAAVALLTFVNNLERPQKIAVADSLVWFGWGVVSAVCALVLTYATHFTMAGVAQSQIRRYDPAPFVMPGPITQRWVALNKIFHIAAVVVGLGSLALFVIGMFHVRAAIKLLG